MGLLRFLVKVVSGGRRVFSRCSFGVLGRFRGFVGREFSFCGWVVRIGLSLFMTSLRFSLGIIEEFLFVVFVRAVRVCVFFVGR